MKSLFLLSALATASLAGAQTVCGDVVCGAEHLEAEAPRFASPLNNGMTPFGLAANPEAERAQDDIFSTNHLYVYRLAVLIDPAVMQDSFHGDRAEAKKWLTELQQILDTIFPRDLGVKLIVSMDERLQMMSNTVDLPMEYQYATEAITKLIGEDAFDIGVLVRFCGCPPMTGAASIGGAYTRSLRAKAWVKPELYSVAHAVGHLLGANHTFAIDYSTLTEPGLGQSVMGKGYGARNYFSLPSIQQIRQCLAKTNYYLDASRDPKKMGGNNPVVAGNENFPYIEPLQTAMPQWDTRSVKREYVVTMGTRFQFYVPEVTNSEGVLYAAHPADGVDPSSSQYSNTIQPTHPATASNCVMFQPYYDAPQKENDTYKMNVVEGSDNYRIGTYSFLLGAFNQGHYQTKRTTLRIVDGNPFRITSNISGLEFTAGQKLNLTWTPQTELYGKDSQVRILLSDDFGQTYKYVLADNVPNTGAHTVYLPHVKIGMTNYRNLPQQIRGGVIKVEVKGEAAYAVTYEEPYRFEGKEVKYPGGFTSTEQGKYIHFENAPAPYVTVEAGQPIPPAEPLVAYHKTYTNKRETIACKEERRGNVIHRTWLSSALNNATPIAYTQIISVRDAAANEQALVRNDAANLLAEVNDLLDNEGELGYPRPEVAAYRQFCEAAAAVFANGAVRDDVTAEAVAHLRESIQQLSALTIDDVVLPADGDLVRLRNYQHQFGKDVYYYAKQDAGHYYADAFTANVAEATQWTCKRVGNDWKLTANGHDLYLAGFNAEQKAFALERGCTWGAFALVSRSAEQKVAYLDHSGENFGAWGYEYASTQRNYRNTRYSTDFQFDMVRGKEVGRLTIATPEGYGTVFTNEAYVMPQGVTGYLVTGTDEQRGEVKLAEAYRAGATVPAQTALVVRGAQRSYKLFAPVAAQMAAASAMATSASAGQAAVAAQTATASATQASPAQVNYLRGSVAAETTTGPTGQTAGYCFYKLYYGTNATGTNAPDTKTLGFYWGAEGGAPFTNAAGKAYLALPQTVASTFTGFALPQAPTTGLCTPVERPSQSAAPTVYTLSGVRLTVKSLDSLPAGIYIVDGQKKVVR